MRTTAIIERASDGMYSIYMDDEKLDYVVTGTGKTVEEAMQCFEGGYNDIKEYYISDGKEFIEVEFEYVYDTASMLEYYSKAFSLVGLSRITGINKGQLSHYVTGHRKPSRSTVEKIQNSIRDFGNELSHVCILN